MKIDRWVNFAIAAWAIISIFGILIALFGDKEPLMGSKTYVKDYFAVVGLPKGHLYEDVEEVYGLPRNIIPSDAEHYYTVEYEGIAFWLSAGRDLSHKRDLVVNVSIYSPEYRFGRKKIGVGSTLNEIQAVYKGFETIHFDNFGDIDCGFIDRFTWLEFYFDENKQVNKIVIYERGP